MKSVWQPYGLSDFPLRHPMVGQDSLYHAFSDFLKSYHRRSGTANIFALIARWGVGKSRFAMEVISQWLQLSKGWILQESGMPGTPLKEFGLDNHTLPVYLSYSDFSHPDSVGDNWLPYGIYRAIEKVAKDPDNSITGQIVDQIQSYLLPQNFIYRRLASKLESGKYSTEDLLDTEGLLDRLIKSGMEYLNEVKVKDLLIFVDEVETMTEIVRLDQSPEREEEAYHIDSEGLQVLGRGLKNDNVRKKYPFANVILLCSPVVGRSITELGALQRRTHVMELDQISFADVSQLIKKLENDKIVEKYPKGLIEAVYSLSGGNMGWFNVIMYDVESYLSSGENDKSLEAVFNHLLKASNRFKRYIINEQVLTGIQTEEKNEHFVRMALLKQTPVPVNQYTAEQLSVLNNAKSYDGTELFKPYVSIKINQKLLTGFLVRQGYKHESESVYADDMGNKIDIKILLRSLSLFSFLVANQKDHCLVGTDEQSITDQLQMLYPVEGASQLARLGFELLRDEIENYKGTQYLGPNFAILQQLNRMYRLESPVIGYLRDSAANQEVEEAIKKILSRPQPESLLLGISRLLELNYPEVSQFELSGVPCLQTTIQDGPYLDVHPKSRVTLIWGKDDQKLLPLLKDKKLLNQGFHPVIVVSDQPFDKKLIDKLSGPGWEGIGRCLIFVEISRLNRDTILAISVDKSLMDIRPTSAQLTTVFKNKITRAKDQLTEKIKEWFDAQDSKGWILRPVLHKNASDHEICLLADGYKRMLIHLTTAAEIGVNPEFKMKSSDYEEFRSLLSRSVFLGQGEKSNNYRETYLFNRQNDTYTANVPPSLIRFLAFLESSNKQDIEFENKFFFSCTQKVGHKKIIDQWIQFLVSIRLIRDDKGFITRISSIDLDRKFELVRSWFDNEYPEMLKKLAKEIKGGSVLNLSNQKPYLDKDLKVALETKNKIDFKSLSISIDNPEEVWSGELQNLDVFHEKCDFIFNKERFTSIKFDENIIRTLKIEDTRVELWYRIGHIFEFIKYISAIRDKSVELIKQKTSEIKTKSSYKDYQMPVSPLINILNRFKNELEWATDFDSTSTMPTVCEVTETLACSLTNYRFEEALNRLNRILSDCGLRRLDNNDLVWDEAEGMCGKYRKCLNYFTESVEYLLTNTKDIDKWILYFKDSEFEDNQCVKNVVKYYNLFKLDIDQGLSERIDDKQEEMENRPFEFVDYLEKELKTLFEESDIIGSELNTTKDLAKDQRNLLINHHLLAAVNKIRRKTDQPEYIIPLQEYPKESSFQKTRSQWKSQEEAFQAEGESYFQANGANTRFDFYVKAIEMKGDLDWDKYESELEELKRLGLVKTRVEII